MQDYILADRDVLDCETLYINGGQNGDILSTLSGGGGNTASVQVTPTIASLKSIAARDALNYTIVCPTGLIGSFDFRTSQICKVFKDYEKLIVCVEGRSNSLIYETWRSYF